MITYFYISSQVTVILVHVQIQFSVNFFGTSFSFSFPSCYFTVRYCKYLLLCTSYFYKYRFSMNTKRFYRNFLKVSWLKFCSMSCCILGKESLDELEEMIGSLQFAKIAKKNVSRKIWNEKPYGDNELAAKIEVS